VLAEVIVGKFLDHLPLHRQAARIARAGVTVAESTLGDWMKRSATVLTPLYRLMLERVRECPVIWSDDTRSRFAKPGERTMPNGHFWAAIGDATAPYTVFHFTTGYDAATGPDQFLEGFRGYVHADCLAQYNHLFTGHARTRSSINWYSVVSTVADRFIQSPKVLSATVTPARAIRATWRWSGR
jgi:transposase